MNLNITEVKVSFSEADPSTTNFRAYCSVVFSECFVVHDIRVLEGDNGPFVCMPSKKRTENCPHCRAKNHMLARYCNNCGEMLRSPEQLTDFQGRELFMDVAHPLTQAFRGVIDRAVLYAYKRALEEANPPKPEAADTPDSQ